MDEGPWTESLARGDVVVALVRHGRTAWNAERRFLGRTDLPLDDVGREQVAALGARWPRAFDAVYSSPLSRALDTARALGAVDPVLVPELAEMHQGELEGLDRDAAVARYPAFFASWAADTVDTCVPGGESLRACAARAVPAVLRIAASSTGGALVGVVTHQLVIGAVSCAAAGDDLARWREHGIPNATVTFVGWDGERLSLLARGWSP